MFSIIIKHPWLFTIFSAVPFVFFAIGVSWMDPFEKRFNTLPGQMPITVSVAHSASIALMTGAVGFFIALSVSWLIDQTLSPDLSRIAKSYVGWFATFWCPSFWALSFFYKFMWLDANNNMNQAPKEWVRNFLIRGILLQYPIAIVTSLGIALCLTVVAIFIGETYTNIQRTPL